MRARPDYDEFMNKLKNLITEILTAMEINYHSIQARTKTVDSFKSKLAKGITYNAKEMNDLVGIRIISYVKSDTDKISQSINNNFVAQIVRDSEKEDSLGVNKVGYKSKHFICELPKSRLDLVELERFSGMRFEIQVRTILEHAWAEINHDRNYKFPGVLPPEIQRRFYLLAGVLEIIDNEFERLCNDVDSYSTEISSKTKRKEFDIPVNSTTLNGYLANKIDKEIIKPTFGQTDVSEHVIQELNTMEIKSIEDLDKLISDDFIKKYVKILEDIKYLQSNYASLLRVAMISKDPTKYFSEAWNKHYAISSHLVNIMKLLGVDLKKIKSFPGSSTFTQ